MPPSTLCPSTLLEKCYNLVMSSAIVLIAHGSRRAEANADLARMAEMLQPRIPEHRVQIAYLELADPAIPEALENCAAQGARQIHMLPYFLSAGSHVTVDLERFREEFLDRHPEIACSLCPPLGLHPRMVDILLDRLNDGNREG